MNNENNTVGFENPSIRSSSSNTDQIQEKLQQIYDVLSNMSQDIKKIASNDLEKSSITNEVSNNPEIENTALETPIVETPINEAPVEEAHIETPAPLEPITENPVIETPIVEIPTVEAPIPEAPIVEAPSIVPEVNTIPEPVVSEAVPQVEEPVLNPVEEKTSELPQEVNEVASNNNESFLSIEDLLKDGAVESQITPDVNIMPQVETPIVETPIVETPSIVPEVNTIPEPQITTPMPSTPAPELPKIEPVVVSAPAPVPEPTVQEPVMPSIDTNSQVVTAPIAEAPVVEQTPAQVEAQAPTTVVTPINEEVNNVELLNKNILNGANAHVESGQQRKIEVDNSTLNNQISNQKTLINKAA